MRGKANTAAPATSAMEWTAAAAEAKVQAYAAARLQRF